MYFDAAEAKIVELETRLAAQEDQSPVDYSAQIAALQSAVAALDARLDAIAAGAQG